MPLCLLFASGWTAQATVYYVDPLTGSDSNDGLARDRSFRTLQHCADLVSPGDTCVALAGHYDEQVTVDRSGTSGGSILFQAEPGAETLGFTLDQADYIHVVGFAMIENGVSVKQSRFCRILDNDIRSTGYVGIDLLSSPSFEDNESVSDCIVRGNTISYAVQCGIRVMGRRHLIENNLVEHTLRCSPYDSYCDDADGMRFFGSDHVFRRNTIRDILHDENPGDPHIDCFQTWRSARNVLFDGNVCINPNTYGSNQIVMVEEQSGVVGGLTFQNNIFVFSDPGYGPINIHQKNAGQTIDDITIVHNLFFHTNVQGMGNYAVNLQRVDGAVVKNNIFVDYGVAANHQSYVEAPESTSLDISHNLVYTSNGIPPYGGPYPHDLWMVDPELTDPANGNYEPRVDSPAIDAGALVLGVAHDILGRIRPIGAPDIGPYELGSPLPTVFEDGFESGDLSRWSAVVPAESEAIPILPVAVTASADDGNVPQNVIDGDLGTRWSAFGQGQWIRFDLGSVVRLDEVRVAWFLGDQRVATFELGVSLDGGSWTTVWSGQSSGSTLDLENQAFTEQQARFVRLLGYGNNQNDWNSVTEVEIYGPP